MGRTNYTILGIGLATCVFLSLMMQHALKVTTDREVPAIVSELTEHFGSRLVELSDYEVQKRPDGRVGVVTIHPMIGLSLRRLAVRAGHFVWNQIGDEERLDALVVVCDTGLSDIERYQVRRPLSAGQTIVLLEDGAEPTIHPQAVPPGGASSGGTLPGGAGAKGRDAPDETGSKAGDAPDGTGTKEGDGATAGGRQGADATKPPIRDR